MRLLIAAPVTLLLVYRALSRKSLTPLGIVAAVATAIAHAIHPWSVFFALLIIFFVGGTAVTKVKHNVKAQLTLDSSGNSGGEGARTHIQVLANSVTASVLILLHAWQLRQRSKSSSGISKVGQATCWSYGEDLLVIGIVANYAAVAADTFSSELGILSKTNPRLITSPTLRKVPPGTNGGVTAFGILAGFLGAFTIGVTSAVLLPFCTESSTSIFGKAHGTSAWTFKTRIAWILAVTVWGALGSLLDSFLGGWLQASVVDTRTGKVIEGSGGKKVLLPDTDVDGSTHFNKKSEETFQSGEVRQRRVASGSVQDAGASMPERQQSPSKPPSRKVESGVELLDNNAVNLLMAFTMSISGMAVAAAYWDVPLQSILS
ncbi:MAG: hypothetical protein M1837_001153 [Sclerophora amabilis]|nr:MAG: hypothetical protein M1837_001153 [Sclerophora amabilis]